MKKNKINNILLIIGLYIFTFLISYFSIANNDVIWTYGFCYNFAKGLKMYADYNMIITPLYPFIFGTILKIFGTNMLVFYLANSMIATSIFYIINKYYKKCLIEMIILITFISGPNYNTLCLLFLFILFVLEDKKKNDYIIGIILGLVFLTKSPMGLLCLSSLYYYKEIKKIIKRIIGFLLPNIILTIIFIKNNIFKDFINYAFGSLFDFANKNFNITFGLIIFLTSIIYLIYRFKKDKDIKLLYILFFQIMSYPIFNTIHIIFSLIPIIFYIILKTDNKIYLKYRKFITILLISPILATIFENVFIDMEYGTNALKYKLIETKYINDSKLIKENIKDLNNTYFIMYEAYYNKLLLGLKINKYDVMLNGNLGYNGDKFTIKYFDSLQKNTKFIIYKDYEGGQAPKEVYYHIKNNYKLVSSFDKYQVYEK